MSDKLGGRKKERKKDRRRIIIRNGANTICLPNLFGGHNKPRLSRIKTHNVSGDTLVSRNINMFVKISNLNQCL